MNRINEIVDLNVCWFGHNFNTVSAVFKTSLIVSERNTFSISFTKTVYIIFKNEVCICRVNNTANGFCKCFNFSFQAIFVVIFLKL